MLFLLMELEWSSSATELFNFIEELEDFLKKTRIIWAQTRDHLCFGVQCDQMDGNCLLHAEISQTTLIFYRNLEKLWKQQQLHDLVFEQ